MSDQYGYIINEKTFQKLYNEHWEKVYSYCFHHCQDEYVAEEIVQDIFLSLWDRRAELVIRQEPQHYLIRSAKLKLFDYYRHCAVIKKHMEESGNTLDRHGNNIQEVIAHKEVTNSVNDLLKRVPEQSALIYRMNRENDFTIRQIALQLDISEKKVEYHLYRTVEFVRQGMLPYRDN